MRIEDFTDKIRALFHHKDSEIPDDLVRGLIRLLEEADQEESYSCEDVFAVVDQYAEIEVRGKDAARLMPLLRKHLDACHDCCEEYEALLEILQHSDPA